MEVYQHFVRNLPSIHNEYLWSYLFTLRHDILEAFYNPYCKSYGLQSSNNVTILYPISNILARHISLFSIMHIIFNNSSMLMYNINYLVTVSCCFDMSGSRDGIITIKYRWWHLNGNPHSQCRDPIHLYNLTA